ncbi:hypothetical protein NDU88_001508 [Pleurodeles waltl]|uniref:Uncharacterized protein n=1 Tax=Pleurodeles waltl TaxID=8319 RepID=A0AAV7VXT4_PLEWA|nr:hypothetical protein NDU88_001508 [Pleurodeles waltl]
MRHLTRGISCTFTSILQEESARAEVRDSFKYKPAKVPRSKDISKGELLREKKNMNQLTSKQEQFLTEEKAYL